MTRTTTRTTIIGPADHGRRMSLEEFNHLEGQEGYLYELSRGVITVMDVPKLRHLAQVNVIHRQLRVYDAANPGRIHTIAGGFDCKILIAGLESERHPDITIYKRPPPKGVDDIWVHWVPTIVIEVVSRSSRYRDYEEKPEEYLRFGVREYWIFDADKRELRVLRRSRGQWAERIIHPPAHYRTRLLPGFALATGPVFEAADAAGD
jgi:Uma2 family endonuclease